MSRTRLYRIWHKMNERCFNPKHVSYKWYGGKGIVLCPEWKYFINFKNDMCQSYLEHVLMFGENNTTIDRIDNNKNYCKENCRWATRQIQAKTQGRSPESIGFVSMVYKDKTIKEWSKILNVKTTTLYKRMERKWDYDRIFAPLERNSSNSPD